MKLPPRTLSTLALFIAAALLLCGTTLAAGPARRSENGAPLYGDPVPYEDPAPYDDPSYSYENYDTVYVETVDELLAAISPYRTIVLAPGVYDLSAASDYGTYPTTEYLPYRWEEVFDGFELVIENADHLAIVYDGDPADAVISAAPRYADVLSFRDSRDVTLSGFTAGHTVEPGQCAGGVIDLQNDANVNIMNCRLYGCGILGLRAENCRTLFMNGTSVFDCSYGAVELYTCYDARMVDCQFTFCGEFDYTGEGESFPAYAMFYAYNCCGVAVLDSVIYNNYVGRLLVSEQSREIYMLDTVASGNSYPAEWGPLTYFASDGDPIIVAGCEFWDEGVPWPGEESCVVDLDRRPLTEGDLLAMTREFFIYEGPRPAGELNWQMDDLGGWWVEVSTVDELLAAIGPDATVYLAPGEYDLTQAVNYGGYGGSYYSWEDSFDGPSLVIQDVENLRLVGDAKDTTLLMTAPRYVNVVTFRDCSGVSLSNLTAGHSQEAGTCVGAVLGFERCHNTTVYGCGLFGCGTLGIDAYDCYLMNVMGNEIYQCSLGAVSLIECTDATFYGNDIHDCAWPTYNFWNCGAIYVDGKPMGTGVYDLPDAGPYRASLYEDPLAVG